MRYINQSTVMLLLLISAVCSDSEVFNSTTTGTNSERPIAIHLLAVVPTVWELDSIKAQPKWKRGEEILPGARLAIKEITDSFNLLSGFQLDVIPIRVPLCDFNTGIVPFVKELTSNGNNVAGIVGYFCHNLAERFLQLVKHEQIRVISISATSSNYAPHLYRSILPSTEFNARAAVLLMQRLRWSHVAVISNQNLNYLNARHTFLGVAKEQGIKVVLMMEIFPRSSQQFLQELQNSGIKIIVAFLPRTEAVDILCIARLNGFTWPDYAWILMEVDDSETVINCPQTSMDVVMDNILFFRPQLKTLRTYKLLPSGLSYSAYFSTYLEQLKESATNLNVSLQSNPYANVIYDSVWAIALAVNGSLNTIKARNLSLVNISRANREIMQVLEDQLAKVSFLGATGLLNFSQNVAGEQISVELFQFQEDHPVQIGLYDPSLEQLLLNVSTLGEIPRDTVNRIYVLFPIPLTILLSVFIVLCLVLTTISMCLFVYHRNQPVIMATSTALSTCMFIGCYFLLSASLFHTIASGNSIQNQNNELLRAFICLFSTNLFNIGLDLVFATVIAKTLRIYHIFKTFGKVNQIWSDRGLFIFISMTVSVKIVLMVLWTCLDTFHLVDKERYISQSVPPYYVVTEECQSRYLGMWLALCYGYSTVLGLAMVFLAILTRKIKRGHFKDSKKINALVAVLFLNSYISISLWAIFRLVDATVPSKVVYSMCSMTTALFCQVFLILPKVMPVVLHKNWLSKVKVVYTSSSKQVNRGQHSRRTSLSYIHVKS